jgi:opacity protein-like surface antigen
LDVQVFLGAGYTVSSTGYTKNGEEQEEGDYPVYPKSLIYVPFGLGLEYNVNRNISLMANARGSYYSTPKEIMVYNELFGGLKAIHDYDWSTHSIDIGIRYYFQ